MRLFLLAPRPKSRRHHINKGWAWFEATSNHIVGIEFSVEVTSARVFFLVFFLAPRTDRVKEGTVMAIS